MALAAWPSDKPIELLVGYAAGGSTDVMARTLAPFVAKHLGSGAQIVVINRPGASGEISMTQLQRAKPDGYTLGIVNMPGYFFLPMYRKSAYDPKEIALIGRVVSDPTILVVRDDSKFKTLIDVVKDAKNKPGTISVGHNGIGTNGHLAIVRLERATGAKFNLIPYNGTAQQKVALAGGHLDIEMVAASEIPDPKQEAVPIRMLAQFANKKVDRVGNVPTTYELGFPVEMTAERGFAAPAGLPLEEKRRLIAALQAAMSDPEYLKAAVNDGPFLAFMAGEQWEQSLAGEATMYEDIAKSLPKE